MSEICAIQLGHSTLFSLESFALNLSIANTQTVHWCYTDNCQTYIIHTILTFAHVLASKQQGSCPFVKIKFKDFKDFQGPYEGYITWRTKLNQTGTFTSIYKRRKLPQLGRGQSPGQKWILCIFETWESKRSHLEHRFQYQLVRSRRFRKSNSSTFKDLQTQIQGLSRTMSVFKDFPGLVNLEKKFKDFQRLSRTRRSPEANVLRTQRVCQGSGHWLTVAWCFKTAAITTSRSASAQHAESNHAINKVGLNIPSMHHDGAEHQQLTVSR